MDMQSISDMEIKNFLGKNTNDIYGRYLGPIVSISKNSNDDLEFLHVDLKNGHLVKYSAEQIMIDQDKIVIIPTWRIEAEKIKKEMNQAQKRIYALEELLEKEEISRDIYESLKLNQSSAINSLKGKYTESIDHLKKRLNELKVQINDFSSFLVEMRTGKTNGKIQDDDYRKALKSIEQNLNYLFFEKQDLENYIVDLESEKYKN
jgi:chromosome segregation ATPase